MPLLVQVLAWIVIAGGALSAARYLIMLSDLAWLGWLRRGIRIRPAVAKSVRRGSGSAFPCSVSQPGCSSLRATGAITQPVGWWRSLRLCFCSGIAPCG